MVEASLEVFLLLLQAPLVKNVISTSASCSNGRNCTSPEICYKIIDQPYLFVGYCLHPKFNRTTKEIAPGVNVFDFNGLGVPEEGPEEERNRSGEVIVLAFIFTLSATVLVISCFAIRMSTRSHQILTNRLQCLSRPSENVASFDPERNLETVDGLRPRDALDDLGSVGPRSPPDSNTTRAIVTERSLTPVTRNRNRDLLAALVAHTTPPTYLQATSSEGDGPPPTYEEAVS